MGYRHYTAFLYFFRNLSLTIVYTTYVVAC
jgi:hypothetical protein